MLRLASELFHNRRGTKSSLTYIEELVHLLSVFCLAPCNQHELAFKISKVVQGEVSLGKQLSCVLQLKVDHFVNAVGCLWAFGTYTVASICQNVSHLPKGGNLN